MSISTPDAKQSECYIATTALFLIFGSSAREEKVSTRLPPTWRDLWTEFAEAKKEKADEMDRDAIRTFRDMVREKRDQELEDGVLIHGAFKNRSSARTPDSSDELSAAKSTRPSLTPEGYQKIWWDKSSSPSYQMMLVSCQFLRSYASANDAQKSRMQLPMWGFKDEVLSAIDQKQVVIICGETGW
jgi:ATP-dependent RNA helicase DHX29